MKLSTLFLMCALLLPGLVFSQLINGFEEAPADTNYWKWYDNVHGGSETGLGGHYMVNSGADDAKGYIRLNYVSDPVFDGAGAMEINYSVHNTEGWGGFSKIEHWHPDSNKTYDFSAYDSISIHYYVSTPQSLPGRVTFRLCLHDVSHSETGNATYTNENCEYYYSFLKILDAAPGWNEAKLPFIADPNFWNGEGFNLTGWVGISGNATLDLDKIKGYTFEFSISGGGEGDFSEGTIVVDKLTLTGLKAIPFVIFNGRAVPSKFSAFTWGQSTLDVVEGAGATAGTNALRWVQGNEWGNGWSGAGFNIDPPLNMAAAWDVDSLKFKMKADEGTGTMRLQFEDGVAKKGMVFDPIADGNWHNYAFKLSDFVYKEGTNFDSSSVKVFQFMAEGTAIAGKTILFDDMWTGNPVIDILAPACPATIDAIPSDYYNLVIWEDVPGESGEVYNVYASPKPITSLDDPMVDIVAINVIEGTQTTAHRIYYPLKDSDVEYYYAIQVKDAAGNVSECFATIGAPIVNKAKGIATISMNPPANFVADGDLTEWDQSGIMPFVIKPENSHVPVGTVTDENDLTGTVYLAVDDNYLYIAADVVDDVYHFGEGNWWDQDAFQLFIGLYDQRGVRHNAILRGAEPDYILYANEQRFQIDVSGGGTLYVPEDANYHFEPLGGADYVVETKIPLDSLVVGNDARFKPMRGMRIPIDIYFHDNDGAGWEGNVGFSFLSTDHQWQNPQEWAFTWIGDTTFVTDVKRIDYSNVISSYKLEQNYPNPFNPVTTINYSLEKTDHVELAIFNQIGQEVEKLVNGVKPAGQYRVTFEAKDLPSGIYFYRLKAGNFEQMKKMILIK